jgi:hypothetical protein
MWLDDRWWNPAGPSRVNVYLFGLMIRQVGAHERYTGLEDSTMRDVRLARSISADKLSLLCQQVAQPTVPVRLFLCGQPKWVIDRVEHKLT